jgi:hypothetical protein
MANYRQQRYKGTTNKMQTGTKAGHNNNIIIIIIIIIQLFIFNMLAR